MPPSGRPPGENRQRLSICYSAAVRDDILPEIVRRQQSAGFPDLAGAEAAVTLPIGDRLINEVIAAKLPAGGSVTQVRLRSEDTNQILVSVHIRKGLLNFPLNLAFAIDEQPTLPQRPVLGLRLLRMPGVLGLAGPAMRFLDVLPPGISLDGQVLRVNLETLLGSYGHADLLNYLTWLQVTTRPGAVVVSARAVIDYPRARG